MVIDGREIAHKVIARLKEKPRPEKFLGAIFVEKDPASASFLRQKEQVAKDVGVEFRRIRFPETIGQEALTKELRRIGTDPTCGGIIVQLPLPSHLNREVVIAAIPKEKDVDNLRGDAPVLAPAALVVAEILQIANYQLPITKFAVVGANGFLVGHPVAEWLASQGASVDKLDIGSDFSPLHDADVVVLGTGKPGLITPELLKEGSLVIDFGYGQKQMANGQEQITGDFDTSDIAAVEKNRISYTPVPGGTGPMVVAKLFENFYALNKNPD